MKNCDETEFVKITNKDIYNKLMSLDDKLDKITAKVNNHHVLIYGVFSVLSLVVGVLIAHVMNYGGGA